MSIFEAMLGASVALGLAIPVFMDKVMRPRYEERFEEFRQASRESFTEEFEDALKKLKQTKETMSSETIDTMEPLFSEWGRIRTNENRLQNILRTRKYLFLGWMVSTLLSLFSIEYSEYNISGELKLGQLTTLIFIVMFLLSIIYILELFSFDERLSKYGRISREGPPSGVSTFISTIAMRGRVMESNVETFLKNFSIPYVRKPITAKGRTVMMDFAIPSSKEPQYIIEVKRTLRSKAIVFDLYGRLERIKRAYPQVKGILVVDFGETSEHALDMARDMWDFVVDFKRLDDLKDIIKL